MVGKLKKGQDGNESVPESIKHLIWAWNRWESWLEAGNRASQQRLFGFKRKGEKLLGKVLKLVQKG